MPSSSTTSSTSTSSTAQSPYQDHLMNYCRNNGLRTPNYQVVSDRRGGRTAWSCTVNVQGRYIQARFWYDGQYVNNAREDAAQMALQALGQLPSTGVQPRLEQQGGQHQQQVGQSQHYYGAISS